MVLDCLKGKCRVIARDDYKAGWLGLGGLGREAVRGWGSGVG